MEVISKEQSLEDLQGIYGLYKRTNGRSSWKSATKAIWYIPLAQHWAIGDLEDIGTVNSKIVSDTSEIEKTQFDFSRSKWNYPSESDYLFTGDEADVVIQCVNDKGKMCLFIFPIYFYLSSSESE